MEVRTCFQTASSKSPIWRCSIAYPDERIGYKLCLLITSWPWIPNLLTGRNHRAITIERIHSIAYLRKWILLRPQVLSRSIVCFLLSLHKRLGLINCFPGPKVTSGIWLSHFHHKTTDKRKLYTSLKSELFLPFFLARYRSNHVLTVISEIVRSLRLKHFIQQGSTRRIQTNARKPYLLVQ